MEATILRVVTLPHIYSASGIEVVNDSIFIAGDDSPWLYVLDGDWNVVDRVLLFPPASMAQPRIPKKQKPDLEALTVLPFLGAQKLFMIGSGSQPNRQEAYLVDTERPYGVEKYDLTRLYDQLRSYPAVVNGRKLNLEGLAATPDAVHLLQRGNVSGTNTLISFQLADFIRYLTHREPLPPPLVRGFTLPRVDGVSAGFSGATAIPGTKQLLFTASVEATDNEIDDGAMLGSFVGLIDLQTPEQPVLAYAPLLWEGKAYPGKVESIAVWQYKPHQLTALAVTDSDGGDSEILSLQITW